MQIIKGLSRIKKERIINPVVTWGVFDGVHLAHQTVIKEVVKTARKKGVSSVVITFHKHPAEVLHDINIPLLISVGERLKLIKQLGVNFYLLIKFTKHFAKKSATTFIKDIIVDRLNASDVILGYDSRFGRNRRGDFRLLKEVGQRLGLKIERCKVKRFHGKPIGSTLIRDLISTGRIKEANRLLGRPFELRGVVIKGKRRGKKIGIPTANLKVKSRLIPSGGVYAGLALLNGRKYKAMINIGYRPTFEEKGKQIIEAYLPGYKKADFYGDLVSLRFYDRIREEIRFKNASDLIHQINRDIKKANAASRNGAKRHGATDAH